MASAHLATYLNDHVAGANIALELLDQLTQEAEDLRPRLTALKMHIEEDLAELRKLMGRLKIAESRVRRMGSWIAEGFAEIKFGMDDDPKGPFRRLERLEALAVGIEGKIALWRALQTAARFNKDLEGPDYEQLLVRGAEQRSCVEIWRLDAASAALGDVR
jgi:hypothetical protein